MNLLRNTPFLPSLQSQRRRGGNILGFFIRVLIYDMIITGTARMLGVSRLTAMFIFLGIIIAASIGVFIMRKKMSQQANRF